jgi:beta-lactamase superfamily II metal-dependent hydrolase
MEIRFLSAGCADAIHILLPVHEGQTRHILIDGGSERGDYAGTLRKELESIAAHNERIALWIITHIDDDHIGGLLRFLRDAALRQNLSLANTDIWFNYSEKDYTLRVQPNTKKSVGQGIRLREYLRTASRLNEELTNDSAPHQVGDLQITLLSPSREKLDQLDVLWQAEEAEQQHNQKKAAKANDYTLKLNEFDPAIQGNDPNVFNGSSIACLLTYREQNVLLTADSHPDTLCEKLKALGYADTDGQRLPLTCMQLAHHGSEANTSAELLGLTECHTFIISANGIKHNLPNKRLLARLKARYPDQNVQVYLTHSNAVTRSILAVDQPLGGLEILFPESGQPYINITL